MANSYDEFRDAGAPREQPIESPDRGPADYGGAYKTDLSDVEKAAGVPAPSISRSNVTPEPATPVNLGGIPTVPNGNGSSKPLTGLSRVAASTPDRSSTSNGKKATITSASKTLAISFKSSSGKLPSATHSIYLRQWDAYINGENQFAVAGTPLQDMYRQQPSTVKQLHAADIHSVEQLANLNDAGIEALNGAGADGVRAAQQFLDAKPLHDLNAEVAKLKAALAERDKQIAELQSQTRSRERPRL